VPAPSVEVEHHGVDQHLSQILERLPERQRLAVIYHYLGDLPYAEVAAVIGGTPEAARRAAADGIAKLRKDRAIGAYRYETQRSVE
jgi:RNA polymerase sigma factor (sigma-70 family)